MPTIETYIIRRGNGRSSSWTDIPFVSSSDQDILNDIGYGTNKQYSEYEYLCLIAPSNMAIHLTNHTMDRGDGSDSLFVITSQ